MPVCERCGNPFEFFSYLDRDVTCPYCGFVQSEEALVALPSEATGRHRRVNLERGKPLVDEALARMERELWIALAQGVRVLTLIHGYGSSGRGGAIREAARERLALLRHQGTVERLVFGEDFEGRSKRGRQLLREYPFLAAHGDLNRRNPGITLVFLPRAGETGRRVVGAIPFPPARLQQ